MISIRRLQKRFTVSDGVVAAIRSLDLEIAEGELFVIVGASGSGKTTLLRCIAGLEVPDGGEILIGGKIVSADNPPTWIAPQHRGLGMVFQSYAVWPHLTVSENIALPLAEGTHRIPRAQVSKRVLEALRLVQLEEQADRPATLLSGGQQQRVALARAIAVSSKLLLMDEPLSNLDARLREDVRGRIRELAKQLHSTVLYVTHDQVEAMAIADKIALMQAGELLQVGTPAEIYHQPDNADVADFFGSVNWLDGEMVEADITATAIGKLRVLLARDPGTSVKIGFRPEALQIADGSTETNSFAGKITSRIFLGDQFTFNADINGRQLFGKRRTLPQGNENSMRFKVDPADILVFAR